MILNLKSKTDLSGFYIIYEGSTFNEFEGVRGISHLCEHLHCKNFDHLIEEFSENAISWNAYTGADSVVFFITGLEEKVNLYRDIFVKLLSNVDSITKEQFENERNIVIEEYQNYFNDQASNHYLNLNRKYFNNYDAIGEYNDLKNLTYEAFLDFYKKYFAQFHKIINVSKKFKYVNNDIIFAKTPESLSKPIEFKDNYQFIFEKGNESKNKTSIACISDVIKDDFAIVKFITYMLGDGLKSPLYVELREKKGLVYYVRCYLDKVNNVSGVIYIDSLTGNENVHIFTETLNNVLNNPKIYLTQERFNVVRNKLLTKNKIHNINRYNNIDDFVNPTKWDVNRILKTLTLDKVYKVYNKYFTNWYISDDKKEF